MSHYLSSSRLAVLFARRGSQGSRLDYRFLKSLFFATLHYPMRANAMRCRLLPSRTRPGKVHLGPGSRSYLHGWTNVDRNFVNAKIDIWADIRTKLPFRAETVEAFYSYHVIEHLPEALLPFHFSEMFRCLKPGGLIRVGGPNGDMAIKKFVEQDFDWFGNDSVAEALAGDSPTSSVRRRIFGNSNVIIFERISGGSRF